MSLKVEEKWSMGERKKRRSRRETRKDVGNNLSVFYFLNYFWEKKLCLFTMCVDERSSLISNVTKFWMWNSTNNRNDGGLKNDEVNVEEIRKLKMSQVYNLTMKLNYASSVFREIFQSCVYFFYSVFSNLVLAPCLIDNSCIELYTTISGQRNNKVKRLFPINWRSVTSFSRVLDKSRLTGCGATGNGTAPAT